MQRLCAEAIFHKSVATTYSFPLFSLSPPFTCLPSIRLFSFSPFFYLPTSLLPFLSSFLSLFSHPFSRFRCCVSTPPRTFKPLSAPLPPPAFYNAISQHTSTFFCSCSMCPRISTHILEIKARIKARGENFPPGQRRASNRKVSCTQPTQGKDRPGIVGKFSPLLKLKA